MVWLEPSLSVALGHSVEVSGQSPKMTVKSVSSCFLYLFFIQSVVTAWDNEELELFDLVEEVSANFYDVLEVSRVNLSDIMCLQLSYRIDVKPNCVFWQVNGEWCVTRLFQEATSTEIRRAYRKLSLVMHPDKNKAPDADDKFRQINAIYEVLKDSKRREQ